MYNKENNPYRHIDTMLKAAFENISHYIREGNNIVVSRVKVMLAHAWSIGNGLIHTINRDTQSLLDIYCKCDICQRYNGLLRTKERNRQK